MTANSDRTPPGLAAFVDTRWRLVTLVFWAGACVVLLAMKWHAIHWFGLGDTDDNIRFDQVRDWLGGQGWYDLRQHRLDPPAGASIHWSRLVDLPIAALYLVARPFVAVPIAWRFACAVAPMLPMLVAMLALAATIRRLVSPHAYPVALVILVCAGSTMLMWSPLRIDHHGWQLAFLMTTVAGLTDPRPTRSGATIAVSSALSLAIGLEMLPYVVFAGATLGLRWAWDRAEARRLRAYGIVLAAATALCFLVFASNDNWSLRCDALTEVWATVVIAAALLLAGIAAVPARSRWSRLALLVAAGGATAALYAGAFPGCAFGGRLEHVDPEAARLWLSHVKEARPIFAHPRDVTVPVAALPLIGILAGAVLLWLRRGTRAAADWLPIVLFGVFAAALMAWQFRAAPSAQMLAVPAAAWAAWAIIVRADRSSSALVRTLVPVTAFAVCSGIVSVPIEGLLPAKPAPPAPRAKDGRPKPNPVDLANRRCPTIPALAPVGRQPAGTVLTFIDAAPRLITLTHMSAIAGPYHRNGAAILDVEHAFRGTPDQALAIMRRHRAAYLLVCPHMSESTIYTTEAPGGFYAKLASGWTPDWLIPVPLPAASPWRMWRLRG